MQLCVVCAWCTYISDGVWLICHEHGVRKLTKYGGKQYQGYFRMTCQHCTKGCLFPGTSIPITLCARCGSCSVHTFRLHDGDTASMGRPDHRISLMPPIKTLREHKIKSGKVTFISQIRQLVCFKKRGCCAEGYGWQPHYTQATLWTTWKPR